MWIFALLLACSPATPPDAPTAAPAAPEPVLLYSFTIEEKPGEFAGTRVFSDGRLEVGAPGPDRTPQWRLDRTLPPDQVKRLQAALDDPAVARTPAILPPDPKAPRDAAPATWEVRSQGALRKLTLNHYGGVAPRTLDPIRALLAPATPTETSTWTVRIGSTRQRFDLACPAARATALKPILRAAGAAPSDPAAPPRAPETALVVAEFHEDDVTWTTAIYDDGGVTRTTPGGAPEARRLPPDALKAVQDAVSNAPWHDATALCATGKPTPAAAAGLH